MDSKSCLSQAAAFHIANLSFGESTVCLPGIDNEWGHEWRCSHPLKKWVSISIFFPGISGIDPQSKHNSWIILEHLLSWSKWKNSVRTIDWRCSRWFMLHKRFCSASFWEHEHIIVNKCMASYQKEAVRPLHYQRNLIPTKYATGVWVTWCDSQRISASWKNSGQAQVWLSFL